MRIILLSFLVCFSSLLRAQFSEELVAIDYEQNQLISIQIYPDIPYIDQMLGGIVINTDDNLYSFVGHGGETKLYTADIATGDILYEVEVPQIQMLQFQAGSDEFIGISKGNPSGTVALASLNYKTGAFQTFPEITALAGISIDTHNAVIDPQDGILFFVSGFPGTSTRRIFMIDTNDGSLIKSFEIAPSPESIAALAYDADRSILLGLLSLTPNGKSLVEIDYENETISEIKKYPDLVNSFGGHRYWTYNDADDEFFVIGLDGNGDSFLYVLDADNGDILFQNPYEDDAWIMEEHSPLEIQYSPNTKQLLGLRKGEPLPPVSTSFVNTPANSLTISPNPVANGTIEVTVLGDAIIQEVSILDINGRLVLKKEDIQQDRFNLSVEKLTAGVYYLLGISEGRMYRQSFVIK